MDKLNKLQDIITDHDETQEILGNKIGVNRNQVRRWIHGESEMGIWKLKKICEHYNISADYILGLEKGLEWPREEKKRYTGNCTKCTFLHNAARAHMFALAANRKRCLGFTCSPWTPLLYRYCLLLRRFTEKRYRDKVLLPLIALTLDCSQKSG